VPATLAATATSVSSWLRLTMRCKLQLEDMPAAQPPSLAAPLPLSPLITLSLLALCFLLSFALSILFHRHRSFTDRRPSGPDNLGRKCKPLSFYFRWAGNGNRFCPFNGIRFRSDPIRYHPIPSLAPFCNWSRFFMLADFAFTVKRNGK